MNGLGVGGNLWKPHMPAVLAVVGRLNNKPNPAVGFRLTGVEGTCTSVGKQHIELRCRK